MEGALTMKRVAVVFLLAMAVQAWGLDPREIVRRMEANQVHKTAHFEGSFSITDGFGTRTKTFTAWSQGEDKMLIEFTNPEEAGQKILRTSDDIYLFFPEAEEVIHLQGSALKDSVMGSDFSYQDLTGEKGLLDLYLVESEGSQSVDGRDCHVLKLTAKRKDIAYPLERMWVDAELFVVRKTASFSLSGKALKEMVIKEVRSVSGKVFPTLMELRDLMKKNSLTVFEMRKITIDTPIDPKMFSRDELSW
jgi:outer membrane lipoprotein-sorting protein